MSRPRQGTLVLVGLNSLGRLGVGEGLKDTADQLVNEVAALVLAKLIEDVGQVKIRLGHRSVPFVSCRTDQEILR